MRYYGIGGCGSDWKLQQYEFTVPVGVGLTGNCSSAMLRHRWVGVWLDTEAVRCYGTGGLGSGWKLQQYDVFAPVGLGLTGNGSSAMLRHRWVRV